MILVILSGLFALGLEIIRLPAALLLGPMMAAILLAVAGGSVRVPQQLVLIAQAVIGCMIARSIPPTIIGEILRDWPLFVAVVIAVIAASSGLGGCSRTGECCRAPPPCGVHRLARPRQ